MLARALLLWSLAELLRRDFSCDKQKCKYAKATIISLQLKLTTTFQGTWQQAMRFCSKLGMSPLTVYNEEKQGCLYEILGISIYVFRTKLMVCTKVKIVGYSIMWTAAKETMCDGKFEWCSQKQFFWLHPSLKWKQRGNYSLNDKCVSIQLDHDILMGCLSRANCRQKNRIICEVSFNMISAFT